MDTEHIYNRLIAWLPVVALSGLLVSNVAVCQEDSAAVPDWIRTGKTSYGWEWLAKRYDADSNGRVVADEVTLSAEVFERLDRDWDGALTAVDFAWEKEDVLGKQKETTFALFKQADSDSDGRLTSDEWRKLFEEHVADDSHFDGERSLNEEQLERMIFRPRVIKAAREMSLRRSDSEYSPQSLAAVKVPQPGEAAPDFELLSPDGELKIRLSQYRNVKPVVLVFGCYTCGNYRTYSETLEQMHRFWKDEVQFLRVYVREAHPTDTQQAATSTNKRAGVIFAQPTSLEERCQVAATFASAMHVTTPMVVDGIDNRVGQAYGAWPDRLYIVDLNGNIAYSGGPGPFGFNPREMEQTLALLLLDIKSGHASAVHE